MEGKYHIYKIQDTQKIKSQDICCTLFYQNEVISTNTTPNLHLFQNLDWKPWHNEILKGSILQLILTFKGIECNRMQKNSPFSLIDWKGKAKQTTHELYF